MLQSMKRKLTLSNDQWWTVAEQTVLVAISAGLTYFLSKVTASDLGNYGALIVVALTGVLSWLKNVVTN